MERLILFSLTQASSGNHVCFAVQDNEVGSVTDALRTTFHQELGDGRLSKVLPFFWVLKVFATFVTCS